MWTTSLSPAVCVVCLSSVVGIPLSLSLVLSFACTSRRFGDTETSVRWFRLARASLARSAGSRRRRIFLSLSLPLSLSAFDFPGLVLSVYILYFDASAGLLIVLRLLVFSFARNDRPSLSLSLSLSPCPSFPPGVFVLFCVFCSSRRVRSGRGRRTEPSEKLVRRVVD